MKWLTAIVGGTYRGPAYTDGQPSPGQASQVGEDFAVAILRVRNEWSRLQTELATVKSAPPPPAELGAIVRTELERRYASAVCGFRFTTDVMGNEHFELFAPDMQPWLSAADTNPAGITTA